MRKLSIFVLLMSLAGSAAAQRSRSAALDTSDRPKIDVESYAVEVTLAPTEHQLKATADVRFRQLERMSYVTFDLDSRLRVDKVTMDGSDVRFRQYDLDSTVEVNLAGTAPAEVTTLHFEYAGALDPEGDKRAPVLASVSEDGAFLLYESRWFPLNNIFKDKATATIRVNAPADWTVVSDLPQSGNGFTSQTASYWGTVAAGKYTESSFKAAKGDLRVHSLAAKTEDVQSIAERAGKIMDFYAETFGPAQGSNLRIIEVAKANWPSRWGVGTLMLSSNQFRSDFDAPALARALAHQWFPLKVAVADPVRDAWLVDGMSVFASLLYAEKKLSPAEAQEQVDKALVKALANETDTSVREAGKFDRESPDYHALVEYKGAYVLRMLHWVVGDEKFNQILNRYIERFQNTPASTDEFAKLAADVSGENLDYFFEQWLVDTGVPEMTAESKIFRVKNGYDIQGEIRQDLDLFRMPVELEIETDGEPEYRRVNVSGSAAEFSLTTERKPKVISIDPRKKILRMSPDIRVAVSINRGEEFMNEGRFNDAIDQFQDAVDRDANNSLASFRMGEALFELGNTTPASTNFRAALNGDLKPKWVEVWAYINMGKIFDIRGDRDRARNEYQKAISTGDDSYGAQAVAQKYLATAFRRGEQ